MVIAPSRLQTQQDADELHRVEHFTGVEWDCITGDYAVWLNGRICGWVPTYHAGEERLSQTAGR